MAQAHFWNFFGGDSVYARVRLGKFNCDVACYNWNCFCFFAAAIDFPHGRLSGAGGIGIKFFWLDKDFFHGLEIFLHGFCYLLFDFDAVQFRVTAQSMLAESDREVPN